MSERSDKGNIGILGARGPSSFALKLWCWVPGNLRSGLRRVASLISFYSEIHPIAKFAGNLKQLKVAYATSSPEMKANLLGQFDAIVDRLILANGVTKTTYTNRMESLLSAVLSAVPLPRSEIRVLDVPASTGAACLRSIAQLQERYRVTSYVLGDKYHTILYDPRRQCVFDEAGNLLQVAFRRLYFRLYRVGILGDSYTSLVAALAFPQSVMARYLRKRYPFRPTDAYQRLLVVHPEVEQRLGHSAFSLQEMDVFQPIPGRYDLILSFNLLHLKYFPADAIWTGIKNLAASLNDCGLLIMGDESSFVALQKQDGSLVPRLREGNWPLGIDWSSPLTSMALSGISTEFSSKSQA